MAPKVFKGQNNQILLKKDNNKSLNLEVGLEKKEEAKLVKEIGIKPIRRLSLAYYFSMQGVFNHN